MGKQRRPETTGETAMNRQLGARLYPSHDEQQHGPYYQATLDFLRVFQDTPVWDEVWGYYDQIRKWRKNEEPHIEAEAQKEGIAPAEWRAKVCLTKLRKFIRSRGLHVHRVFNANDRHKMGLPADGEQQSSGDDAIRIETAGHAMQRLGVRPASSAVKVVDVDEQQPPPAKNTVAPETTDTSGQPSPPDLHKVADGNNAPRSAPMSKTELAKRILHNSSARPRDIDWQRFDLQSFGTKHTVKLNTDAVDAAMRARLEAPVQ